MLFVLGMAPDWTVRTLARPGHGVARRLRMASRTGSGRTCGKAYAVYGVYIVASLGWLWAVEGTAPDRWDVIGAAICLAGAAIILWMPRSA